MPDNKKDGLSKFFNEKEDESKPVSKKKRKGKITLITKNRIILDFNGNGESIPYIEKEHSTLKVGDTMEI